MSGQPAQSASVSIYDNCPRNEETMVQCALQIAKNAFSSDKVNLPRVMHVETNLLDCIGDVGPGESQVLERFGGISNRRTVIG